MPRALPVFYAVTAAVCLAAPYATASRGLAEALFPYTSGPFALTSIALGLGVYLRKDRGWVEVAIATLWAAGAIALSVQLSAPPLQFEDLFLGVRIQTILAGSAAVAMLVAAFRAFRRTGKSFLVVAYPLALLGLATLLARRCLMGLGVLPSPGGIDAVAPELRLAQLVLAGCAAAILLVLFAPRIRRAWPEGRRPTKHSGRSNCALGSVVV